MSTQKNAIDFRSTRPQGAAAPLALSRTICADQLEAPWARSKTRRHSGGPGREPLRPETDASLYWLMLAVGIIPVIVAVWRGGIWGVAPTIGALFCVLALRALLVAHIVRLRARTRRGLSGLGEV